MEESKRLLLLSGTIFFICLLFSPKTIAQTEFFNSKTKLFEVTASRFYSSFSTESKQVYFKVDYKVYA